MFDYFKKLFGKKTKTTKELATERGEPYVNVLSVDIDPKSPKTGSFELDWNIHFIELLRKSGYVGKTQEQVIDQWFNDVCRNVVLESYEQEQADPANRSFVTRKPVDKNRSEIG
jgi:hypothetical protein